MRIPSVLRVLFYSFFVLFSEQPAIAGKSVQRKISNYEVKWACEFKKTCESLAQNAMDPNIFVSNSGLVLPNLALSEMKKAGSNCGFTEEVTSSNALSSDFKVSELFKRNKAALAKYLSGWKMDSEIRKNMLSRLSKVKLVPPSESDRDSNCSTPNAVYDAGSHSLTICRSMAVLPDEAVSWVVLHELSHSIDPCSMTYVLGKVKGQAKGGYISKPVEKAIGGLAPGEIIVENKSVMALNNPFNQVMSCLDSQNHKELGFPNGDDELKALLKAKADKFKDMHIPSEMIPGGLIPFETAKKLYPAYKYCSDLTGSSFATEAFADWLATEVIGSYVAAKKADARLGFGFLLSVECPDAYVAINEEIKKKNGGESCGGAEDLLKETLDYSGDQLPEKAEHARSLTRFEKIYLAQPEIAKAYGCEPRTYCH